MEEIVYKPEIIKIVSSERAIYAYDVNQVNLKCEAKFRVLRNLSIRQAPCFYNPMNMGRRNL
jgi:hypothetical protein